jgi:hypothetical protein
MSSCEAPSQLACATFGNVSLKLPDLYSGVVIPDCRQNNLRSRNEIVDPDHLRNGFHESWCWSDVHCLDVLFASWLWYALHHSSAPRGSGHCLTVPSIVMSLAVSIGWSGFFGSGPISCISLTREAKSVFFFFFASALLPMRHAWHAMR